MIQGNASSVTQVYYDAFGNAINIKAAETAVVVTESEVPDQVNSPSAQNGASNTHIHGGGTDFRGLGSRR